MGNGILILLISVFWKKFLIIAQRKGWGYFLTHHFSAFILNYACHYAVFNRTSHELPKCPRASEFAKVVWLLQSLAYDHFI